MRSNPRWLVLCARFSCRIRSRSNTDRCSSRSIRMANPNVAGGSPAPSPSPDAQSGVGGINFKGVLQELIRRNGSDLHLKVGRPPTIRVDGELVPLDQPALRPEDLKALAEQLMKPRQA